MRYSIKFVEIIKSDDKIDKYDGLNIEDAFIENGLLIIKQESKDIFYPLSALKKFYIHKFPESEE